MVVPIAERLKLVGRVVVGPVVIGEEDPPAVAGATLIVLIVDLVKQLSQVLEPPKRTVVTQAP